MNSLPEVELYILDPAGSPTIYECQLKEIKHSGFAVEYRFNLDHSLCQLTIDGSSKR
jgi:hypothetical protein